MENPRNTKGGRPPKQKSEKIRRTNEQHAHDCTKGHRAMWSGEQAGFRLGALLGALARGAASGATRAIVESLFDSDGTGD